MAAVADDYADIFCDHYKPYPKDKRKVLLSWERALFAEASSTEAIVATSGSMAAWGVWHRCKTMKIGRDYEHYNTVKEFLDRYDRESIAIKKDVIEKIRVKLGQSVENLWRARLRKHLSLRKPDTHSRFQSLLLMSHQRF